MNEWSEAVTTCPTMMSGVRYARSLANAKQLMHILDQAFIFDNSSTQPDLIFEIRAGKVITRAETLPLRAADLLE
ncbi:MAG TPA: hypothetical protein VHY84_00325 [Bryobacteraceae bacterium]|nr:hypothetical protein [Bryobacteraceae bacterium]